MNTIITAPGLGSRTEVGRNIQFLTGTSFSDYRMRIVSSGCIPESAPRPRFLESFRKSRLIVRFMFDRSAFPTHPRWFPVHR